jgi:hypothetical protein
MPFDDISGDLRGVARCKVFRNAEPILYGIEVPGFDDRGLEAGIPQVSNPPGATPAARITMNRDQRLVGCEGGSKFKCRCKAETYGQRGPSR